MIEYKFKTSILKSPQFFFLLPFYAASKNCLHRSNRYHLGACILFRERIEVVASCRVIIQ